MKEHYDSIVIGSGAGGMTTALALAKKGQKVLLSEKHKVAGGWTHSFSKNGYRFNTGVHYIGDVHKGGGLRWIYEGLGVSRDLIFLEMNPDAIDHVLIGDEKFDIPADKNVYIKRLIKRFPEEEKGILSFFKKIDQIVVFIQKFSSGKWKYLLTHIGMIKWVRKSGQYLIDNYLSDPLLKAIVCSQIGIHGISPSRISVAFLASGIVHYFNGAYHPYNGGMAIGKAFIKLFKEYGGELILNNAAERILIENGKAVGIKFLNGEIASANNIISNADPSYTFRELIGEEHLSTKLKKKINRMRYSTSGLSLFLVVEKDLRKMGLDSGNYWIYDSSDMNQTYEQAYSDLASHQIPNALFVTVTTLKDPGKMKKDHHQIEIFTLTGYDAFRKWANKEKGNRGKDYEALKEEISLRMLEKLEEYMPGIKDAVIFRELGTPLTNKHYINAPEGNLYGIEKSIRQVGPGSFSIKTELENLFLCGASTTSHGIAGATQSGLIAACKVLKCRKKDILDNKGPELKIFPSEDPASWPDWMKSK